MKDWSKGGPVHFRTVRYMCGRSHAEAGAGGDEKGEKVRAATKTEKSGAFLQLFLFLSSTAIKSYSLHFSLSLLIAVLRESSLPPPPFFHNDWPGAQRFANVHQGKTPCFIWKRKVMADENE